MKPSDLIRDLRGTGVRTLPMFEIPISELSSWKVVDGEMCVLSTGGLTPLFDAFSRYHDIRSWQGQIFLVRRFQGYSVDTFFSVKDSKVKLPIIYRFFTSRLMDRDIGSWTPFPIGELCMVVNDPKDRMVSIVEKMVRTLDLDGGYQMRGIISPSMKWRHYLYDIEPSGPPGFLTRYRAMSFVSPPGWPMINEGSGFWITIFSDNLTGLNSLLYNEIDQIVQNKSMQYRSDTVSRITNILPPLAGAGFLREEAKEWRLTRAS